MKVMKEKAPATLEINGKRFICLPLYLVQLERNCINADEDSVAAMASIGAIEITRIESTGVYYVAQAEADIRIKNSNRKLRKTEQGWHSLKEAVYQLFKQGIYVNTDDLCGGMLYGLVEWKKDEQGIICISDKELLKRIELWAPERKTGLERSLGTFKTAA